MPRQAVTLENMALALMHLGDERAARNIAMDLVSLSNHPEQAARIGYSYAAVRNHNMTVWFFQKAIALGHLLLPIATILSNSLMLEDRFDEASAVLKSTLAEVSDLSTHTALVASLVCTLQQTALFDEAQQWAEQLESSLRRRMAGLSSSVRPDYDPDADMHTVQGFSLLSPELMHRLSRWEAASLQSSATAAHTLFSHAVGPAAGLAGPVTEPVPYWLPHTRLRVGYVSGTGFSEPFRTDVNLRDLFGLHDRRRFHIFCYALGTVDPKHVNETLPLETVKSECETFVDLSSRDFAAVASHINGDGVHVLADLHGFRREAMPRAFALQPAPVAVNFHGQPLSMGADWEQLLLTDRITVPPDLTAVVSEHLSVVPHSYYFNEHWGLRQSRAVLLSSEKSAARLAVFANYTGSFSAEDSFVFCSFNHLGKFDVHTWALWMDLLAVCPTAVLWLHVIPKFARKRLLDDAHSRGVTADRFVWTEDLPSESHVWHKGACDLFLDSPLFNGHNSALDALWAGVPVLTLPGEQIFQRVASSLLSAVGLPTSVRTMEEYHTLAVAIYSLDRSRSLRRALEAARPSSVLYDSPRWVRNWERQLHAVWDTFLMSQSAPQFFHTVTTDTG